MGFPSPLLAPLTPATFPSSFFSLMCYPRANCPQNPKYPTITELGWIMIRKTAIFLVAACLPALADFSYDQTSKITGGMMAGMMKFAGAFSKQPREPMVNTLALEPHPPGPPGPPTPSAPHVTPPTIP